MYIVQWILMETNRYTDLRFSTLGEVQLYYPTVGGLEGRTEVDSSLGMKIYKPNNKAV